MPVSKYDFSAFEEDIKPSKAKTSQESTEYDFSAFDEDLKKNKTQSTTEQKISTEESANTVEESTVPTEEPKQQEPTDLISKAFKIQELKKKGTYAPVYGTGGSMANPFIPDEKSKKEAENISNELRAQDINADELYNEVKDLPKEFYETTLTKEDGTIEKPYTKESLSRMYVEEPVKFKQTVNQWKNRLALKSAADELTKNGKPTDGLYLSEQYNSLNEAPSFDQWKKNKVEQQSMLNTYISSLDDRRNAIKRLEEESGRFLTPENIDLQVEYNSSPLKDKVDISQYAALENMKLFHPDKYEQAINFISAPATTEYSPQMNISFGRNGFEAGGVSEVESEESLNKKLGREAVLKNLSDEGRYNTMLQLQRNNETLVAASKKATTPEQIASIKQQYEDNNAKIQAVKDDYKKDDERYPLIATNKYNQQVKDISQQAGFNAAEYAASKFAQGFVKTGKSLENVLINIFGDKQDKVLHDLTSYGEYLQEQSNSYLPNKYNKDNPVVGMKVDKPLQQELNKVTKGRNLSDLSQDEVSQLQDILSRNQNQVHTVTNTDKEGKKANYTASSVLYSNAGMIGDILSFGAQAYLLGGLGLSGKVSSAVSMWTTAQDDFRKEAIANGSPDPDGYANVMATIIGAAGLISPNLDIVKRAVGLESKAGQMLAGVSEKTWDKVISKNKPIIDRLYNSVSHVGKEAVNMGLTYGAGVPIAQGVVGKEMYNKPESYNQIFENALQSTEHLLISSAGLLGLGAITNFKSTTLDQKAGLWSLGSNKDISLLKINEMVKNNELTPEQAAERKRVIEDAANIIDKMPTRTVKGELMTDKQRLDYFYNSLIKDQAKKQSIDIPKAQQDKIDYNTMVADHLNDLTIDPKTNEELEARKKELETSADKNKIENKAELEAINTYLDNKAKEKQPVPTTEELLSSTTGITKPQVDNVQNILDRVSKNESINENEIKAAEDVLYTVLGDNPETAKFIEPLILKLQNHENVTKTETIETVEREPIEGTLAAKRKIEIKPVLEQSDGSTATITLADGTTKEGTLKLKDGNYVLEVEGEEPIVIGEKAITDRDLKVPEGESPVELDENGNVKSATFETKDGHKVTITDPEKALDLGIQLSLETVGEIPDEAFDKVYEDVVKETKVEVPVKKPKIEKKAEAETEAESPEQKEQKNREETKTKLNTLSDEKFDEVKKKAGYGAREAVTDETLAKDYHDALKVPEAERTEKQNKIVSAVNEALGTKKRGKVAKGAKGKAAKFVAEHIEDTTTEPGKENEPVGAPPVQEHTVETIDNADTTGFSEVQKKNVNDAKRVIKAITKLVGKGLLKNLKIVIHSTRESAAKAIYDTTIKSGGTEEMAKSYMRYQGNRGWWASATGEIHLNMAEVTSETALHEGVHPILDVLSIHNKKIIDQFHRQLEGLPEGKELTDLAKDTYGVYDKNGKLLNESEVKIEAITDYIAKVADGQIKIDASNFQKVKDYIVNLLTKIGLAPEKDIRTIEDLRKLAQTVSEKFAKGEEIQLKDVGIHGEIKDNPKIKRSTENILFAKTKYHNSGIEKIPTLDTEKFDEDIKKGRISVKSPKEALGDKTFVINQPDDLFVGKIKVNGKEAADFGGGIIYAASEGADGGAWASVAENSANTFVNNANKSLEINNGEGVVTFVKGSDIKHATSLSAKVGFVKVLLNYAKGKEGYDGLINAIKDTYSIGNNKKAENVIELFDNYLKGGRMADGQTMNEAKTSYDNFRASLIKNANPIITKMMRDMGFDSPEYFDATQLKKGNYKATGKGIDVLFAELGQEDFLKKVPTGSAYAAIKFTSPLRVVKREGHPSYPFAIETVDGSPVKLEIFDKTFMVYGENQAILGREPKKGQTVTSGLGQVTTTTASYKLDPKYDFNNPASKSLSEKLNEYESIKKSTPEQKPIQLSKSKDISLQTKEEENGRTEKERTTREVKVNSEKVQYNGTNAIGSRTRPESEQIASRNAAKEKIKNPETNASLKAANSYNKSVGLPEVTPHKYKPSDPVQQTKIAKLYPKLQDVNSPSYKETSTERNIYSEYKRKFPKIFKDYDIKDYKDLVHKSYEQLIKETQLQYDALPIKITFHENGEGNYENNLEMIDDVHNFNHLWVYKGGDDHTELGSKTMDKNGLTANDKFRGVHDKYGHSVEGYQFGKDGEENAWIEHSKMFSPLAQWALSSETRGQNSWVNYSGVNDAVLETIKTGSALKKEGKKLGNQEMIDQGDKLLSTVYDDFKFAEQKAIILPPEYTDISKFHTTKISDVPKQLKNDTKNITGVSSEIVEGTQAKGLNFSKKKEEVKGTLDGKPVTFVKQPENVEVVNGFYSPIEKRLTETKIEKQSANKWKEVVGKGDEAKYTGVLGWLESLPPTQQVSKSEIQNWMKDNRIEINEVTKSELTSSQIKERDLLQEQLNELGRKKTLALLKNDKESAKAIEDEEKPLYEKLKPLTVNSNQGLTKYSVYQLPGEKTNYKEVLVTLPKKEAPAILEKMPSFDTLDYAKNTYGVKSNEYLRVKNDIEDKLENKYNLSYSDVKSIFADYESEKPSFKSSHYNEPNILAHIRMNTRVDAEGNKVLHIEEFQSDWGQKGKKEGFGKKMDISIKESPNNRILTKDGKVLLNTFSDKEIKDWQIERAAKESGIDINELITDKSKSYYSEVDGRKTAGNFLTKEEATANANDEASRVGKSDTPEAPFVTKTADWTKLAWKVALKEAIKEGADKITWTTGEQQNERYDLRKQVDEVNYYKTEDGKYHITADKGGESISSGIYKENELEGILGKEVAKKIVGDEGEQSDRYNSVFGYDEYGGNQAHKTLKGDDLAVGGTGMKGFYGSPSEGKLGIVGEVAKSLFKQEPKTTELDTKTIKLSSEAEKKMAEEGWTSGEPSKEAYSTQHSIDITPEMKAQVESGMPMFSKTRDKKMSDMKDILKEYVDEGKSLKEIKDILKDEFGDYYKDVEGVIEQAHAEMTTTGIKNAVTERERGERGLKEIEVEAKRSFGDVFDDAKQMVADGKANGLALAAEVVKNPRPLKAEESAVLLIDRMRISNEYNKKNAELLDAQDKGENDKADIIQSQMEALEQEMDLNDEAARKSGYEQGLGLAARRMLIAQDYSLVTQMNRLKAANGGAEVPKKYQEQLKDLTLKLEEANNKLDKFEKNQAATEKQRQLAKIKPIARTTEQIAKEKENIKNKIVSKWGQTLSRMKAVVSGIKKSVAPSPVSPQKQAQLESIVSDVNSMVKLYAESGETNLRNIIDNIHADLVGSIPDLELSDVKDIITGIYDKEKIKTPLTPEKIQALANVRKVKTQIDMLKEELKNKQRNVLEKGMDYLQGWHRLGILSGAPGAAKIGTAALSRGVVTRGENVLGQTLSLIPGIRGIAKKAPRHGGMSAKAEAKAFTTWFDKMTKEDVMQTMKTGLSDLDYTYGGKEPIAENIPHWMTFFGRLHSAMKLLPKRAEFFRSLEMRTEQAIKEGKDPNNAVVQQELAAGAYNDALRAVFMQDNPLTSAYSNMIKSMEKDYPAFANTAKFLLPIVKVPTNYVSEATSYVPPIAAIKMLTTLYKGRKGMSGEQADYFMRALKKGALGTAFIFMGYMNPQAVGGYYTGKRKKEDLEAGDIELFGTKLPHFMLHTPLLEMLQIGATMRRAHDAKVAKGEEPSRFDGIPSAFKGLSKQIPFFGTGERISNALEREKSDALKEYFYSTGQSLLEPQLMQNIADWTDKKEGETVKRKTDTFGEKLKEGIPGLRSTLKEEKYKFTDKEYQQFSTITEKGLNVPELNKRTSYKIKIDAKHPDGHMSEDEYDSFIPLQKEYVKEKYKSFYNHNKSDIDKLQKMIDNKEDKAKINQLKDKIQNKIDAIHNDAIKHAKSKLKLN